MRSSSTRIIRLTRISTRAALASATLWIGKGLQQGLHSAFLCQQQLLRGCFALFHGARQVVDQVIRPLSTSGNPDAERDDENDDA